MNIFLSRYHNKIDKKGRVSVPAGFRSVLVNEKFNGIIIYPSFKNNCLEACSMSRLKEIYEIIQSLDPYSEERDAFETIVMGESIQLPFDNEGRVVLPANLANEVNISENACFVGKGLIFEIWDPQGFDEHLKAARNIAKASKFILKEPSGGQMMFPPTRRDIDPHYPVLLSEFLENLKPQDGKKYLDCTFGAGGYTKALLDAANCFVTAIDQDPNVMQYVQKIKENYNDRFEFIEGNFARALELTNSNLYDGIVLDLGVSSMQLDEGERGFSFMRDGPLDMRMSAEGLSAADFIARATEEEIANVIYKYGQEVQSRQIAKNIVSARLKEPITTTLRLAEIVRSSMHYRKAKIDPATKTFQAIRIYINNELESLEQFLDNLKDMLKPEGRILIVSFHSLEDSIVKAFFRDHSFKKISRSKYAKESINLSENKWLKLISKKPISPSENEVRENYRSRSAKLRVAQKLEGKNDSI